ncbi:hypothetical protein Dimus_017062 [Dionaea muscipula]
MAGQVAPQKHHLAAHHEREARAGKPDRRPEPVPVHHGGHQRGEDDPEDLKRLGELEPQEGHEDEDGVVEQLEKGHPPPAEDGEEAAEDVEEAGEVEDVGPEEDAAGGAGAEREAEEPLQGGLGAAPEPTGLADLGGRGEQDAGEDGDGDDGHGE